MAMTANEIFRMSEMKLLRRLRYELKEMKYEEVRISKKYVYAKGTIPIMLVAHLDTVHKELPKEIFFDRNQSVFWSPQGLGADDRAGVLAIMSLLRMGYRPTVLFTTEEEIGGVGAKFAAKSKELANGIMYLIELDRKGSDDAVFYDCDNPEFTKYVEGFGFKEQWGSFSDISSLCPAWGIAGVNLSTGYYHAHTLSEYLNMRELKDIISRVAKMLENPPEKPFEYIECNYRGYYSKYYRGSDSLYDYCDICGFLYLKTKASPMAGTCQPCYDKYYTKLNDDEEKEKKGKVIQLPERKEEGD